MAAFVRRFFTRHPLTANSIIYGSLYVGAEFSQQVVTKKYLVKQAEPIDTGALGRYAVMGTFVYSPILYNWYKWLDRKLPGATKMIVVKKLAMDQFLITPILLVIFFTGMSVMERASDPLAECREKFLPTFARSCLFWLPAQTANFLWIPPHLRVVYIGGCALVWVNILCWVKRQQTIGEASSKPSSDERAALKPLL